MPEERVTQILNGDVAVERSKPVPITSDLAALYEMIKSTLLPGVRKDAVTQLIKLCEEGSEIEREEISALFGAEKDITVASELKRLLNKLEIKRRFSDDPTSKYDRKLSPAEEAKILEEIDRVRKLYDKSVGATGAFKKKYRIVGEIAEGGMGRILKGIRRADNCHVAVKLLLLEELSKENASERIIARFKREGEILKRLSHPNIVKALEYGDANGEYFLVMELIEGETLEERLENNALDFDTFKAISQQLCDAVEYLHKNGVIHRDIKPGNILIRGDGQSFQIKLCDFGLAKDKKNKKLSRFAFTAGTGDYASPQQSIDARDADERDDIFSMGKTFYQMLSRKMLPKDEEYVDIELSDAGFSKGTNEVIKKCISYEKKDRWQTVGDLRSALMGLNK